ncbi:MAG: anti-sigma factor [Vicinamibacterales bacterium]
MMHVLACEAVREDLQAYHDRELTIEREVQVAAHLHDCVACRLESAELADLGAALREMSATVAGRAGDVSGHGLPRAVLERLRVEEEFSLRSQVRGLFEDMHFVWAALGATLAATICLAGSVGVLHAVSRERPDSLAGIISQLQLANPGSNQNPMRLDRRMRAPRPYVDASFAMTDEDAVFALSAVVTREGRIQNIELLVAEQARQLKVKPEVVLAMLDAASRARFAPARRIGADDVPVAVSMVWLLANTTVKGQPDLDLLVSPARWPGHVQVPVPPPPVPEAPDAAPPTKPSAESSSLAG